MNISENRNLLSERSTLEKLIAATPEDQVLTRRSLAARLERVESAISESPVDEREPAAFRLAFRGAPVVGETGVFAEFGAKAIAKFNDWIAALSASVDGPIAQRGPLPNRGQNQLLITATVHGSFGFELREYSPGQLRLDDISTTRTALDQAHRLFLGVLGTDDELTEAADGIDSRAIDRMREFLSALAEADAWCTAELGGVKAAFPSVQHVRRGLDRIGTDNLVEQEVSLAGHFIGVLPKLRTFEFEVKESGEVIRGKVAETVDDIDALNQLLRRPVTIRVMSTRAGKVRPRYRLLEPPVEAE